MAAMVAIATTRSNGAVMVAAVMGVGVNMMGVNGKGRGGGGENNASGEVLREMLCSEMLWGSCPIWLH